MHMLEWMYRFTKDKITIEYMKGNFCCPNGIKRKKKWNVDLDGLDMLTKNHYQPLHNASKNYMFKELEDQ